MIGKLATFCGGKLGIVKKICADNTGIKFVVRNIKNNKLQNVRKLTLIR